MPLHNGIIVSAAVKYRFIIAVLLMYILYSHWSYNNDLFSVIEKAEKDLTSCQYHAESLVAKLRVIYDYKTKMEKMFNTKRENWQLKYASINRQRQNCEESLLAAGEDLEKCKSGRRDQIPLPQSPEKVQLAQLQEEVRTLKTTNLSLNEALLKREESLRTCDEELSKAKSSLSVCNEMVEKYAGVLPVAHYTGNETAFFERKHKADSALAFNREPDAFQPPKLLPGKELVAKLAEKARNPRRGEDDADKHPDDRDNNDNYVNEVPDLNEKDYKVPGR